MGYRRFLRQDVISATTLGLNGVTLDAEKTSNAFTMAGDNLVLVYVNATRAAYTALQVILDLSPSTSGDDWYSSADTTKSVTIATSTKWVAVISNASGFRGRIRISATAGGVTDTAVVTVIRAYQE